ncbi:transposase [Propionibacterium acidifaciens]|uniref:transposase n=1 Tax=Propionibacterium acidifaciens TaxID=556499 RepID=UPI0028DB342D|nr:transposase [Propionibacterium acidifaciens]
MSAPKYSAEFKEQVVLEIVQKSRPMAGVAGSYGLVAQTVGNWVAGWRREHPDLGADAMTAEEHAEIKRLKAELREARMENEFLKKAAAFSARESG